MMNHGGAAQTAFVTLNAAAAQRQSPVPPRFVLANGFPVLERIEDFSAEQRLSGLRCGKLIRSGLVTCPLPLDSVRSPAQTVRLGRRRRRIKIVEVFLRAGLLV